MKKICSSCTVHTVLFALLFIIRITISSAFIYYNWNSKRKHTDYITIKNDDNENINSVNPLYILIGKADRYIEENNVTKYLVFTSTDGNKKVLAKLKKIANIIHKFF